MRFLLATLGSLGDLHPFLAVGRAMRERGHEVILASHPHYRPKAEALGLRFAPIRPEEPDWGAQPGLVERLMDARRGTETVFREFVLSCLPETTADLAAVAGEADVLVSHPLTLSVPLLAEKLGRPWASTALAPISLFSAHDPPALPPMPWLAGARAWGAAGRGLVRGIFGLGALVSRRWLGPWHLARAELGLPPSRDNPIMAAQHSAGLVLALFSRHFAPPAPDWPSRTVATGFPFFDGDEAAPPDLARFLDAGPPPLVFALGSSAVKAAGDFYELALAAARQLGRRAALVTGPHPANRPPSAAGDPAVLCLDHAPYSALFPHAALNVHQGGVGTTSQALRAGRPMLVVPFAHDQFDNAARCVRLGVARSIPRRRLSVPRLVAALGALLGDSSVSAAAARVAAAVGVEDGPGVAADALVALGKDRPAKRLPTG